MAPQACGFPGPSPGLRLVLLRGPRNPSVSSAASETCTSLSQRTGHAWFPPRLHKPSASLDQRMSRALSCSAASRTALRRFASQLREPTASKGQHQGSALFPCAALGALRSPRVAANPHGGFAFNVYSSGQSYTRIFQPRPDVPYSRAIYRAGKAIYRANLNYCARAPKKKPLRKNRAVQNQILQ